jgi:F-type H+-transporting ATPase subunit delta
LIRDVAAKRYAEAAYLIAQEDGTAEQWAEGLRALSSLCGDAGAASFLGSSRVPPKEKRALVEKALAGVPRETLNLALLLLQRGRTALGPQIAEAYQELLDAATGVSHATITTAVDLTADELAAVKQKLGQITGGDVVIETEVDEGIIGGIIVRIGDRLIDGSTKNRLLELKQKLAGTRS